MSNPILNSSTKNILVVLVLIFIIGCFAYTKVPIQLSPDVSQASINIESFWRSASPVEMDREIFRPIEKQMREIAAIQSIDTYTFSGYGWMTLKFRSVDEADAVASPTFRRRRAAGCKELSGGWVKGAETFKRHQCPCNSGASTQCITDRSRSQSHRIGWGS